MSFILEALTQSEEERHRGEVPSFSSPPTTPFEAPAKAPRWPYVLSVALLLNLIVAVAWLIAWGPGEEPAVAAQTATPGSVDVTETEDRQPVPVEKSAEPDARPSATPAVRVRAEPAAGPAAVVKPEPAKRGEASSGRVASAAADETLADAAARSDHWSGSTASVARVTSAASGETLIADYQGSPKGARSTTPSESGSSTWQRTTGVSGESPAGSSPVGQGTWAARDNVPRTPAQRREEIRQAMRESLAALPYPTTDKAAGEARREDAMTRRDSAASDRVGQPSVPGVRDLPGDVRAMLPDIDFTVHVYSRDPAARIVRVNGKMLGEGDAITGKLRLLEITRGGVIMEAGGNLFQMGAREEWLAR